MKKLFCSTTTVFLLLLFALAPAAQAQDASPVGTWRTIDDETNEPKSIVEIYEGEDGKLYGRVVEILQAGPEAERNAAGEIICTACDGDKEDQPVVGMVIIEEMEADGDEWEDGTILDPSNGKVYKAKMSLDGADRLDVRGYVGFSFIGRTQTWERVADGGAATSDA